MEDAQLASLAARVGMALSGKGLSLATAESCTGGWIAKLVTDVSGSSNWFDRGFVTYSNAAKTEMLRVPAELIDVHGAVSREVIVAMARGALDNSRAAVSVAVSGIAGPAGGSPDKPVGTVWIAWARRGMDPVAIRRHFEGDRDGVRRRAVAAALEGVIERIETGIFCPVAGG